MDIFTYIKKDHRKVSALFAEIIAATTPEEKRTLYQTMKEELLLHAESEHSTFYMAIKNKSAKTKEEVKTADEEHQAIKTAIKKLDAIDVGTPEWLIQFGELKAIVEHHVKEEEGEIFQTAKKVLSKTRAQDLAEEMEEKKQKILDRETSII